MPDLHALASLAKRQHAAIIYEQALDLGYDSATLARLCQKGLLDLRSPRIYTLAGAPRTRHQDLVGHVLAAGTGALATADSALGLWCPELELPPVPEIAVAQTCRYRPVGVHVRRSRDLHLAKPTVIDGIPVVGIARALLDAAVGRSGMRSAESTPAGGTGPWPSVRWSRRSTPTPGVDGRASPRSALQ